MQSKTKNFRFTEAMCSDLDKLVSVWHCTATEAVARALNQVSVLEDWKAYQAAQQIPESHPAKQEPEESTRRRDTGAAAPQPEPPQDAAAPEQQPEPDRAAEPQQQPAAVQPQAQDKPKKGKRLQVRIYKGAELVASPSGYEGERDKLDEKVKGILASQNLEPVEPFEHTKGKSYRINCK